MPISTATPTPAATATPTASITPGPVAALSAMPATSAPIAACEPRRDARLVFQPNEIDLRGSGPLGTSIVVTNNSTSDAAADVLIVLGTTEGAGYIQSVAFSNGQVWTVNGQPSTTLYLAGNVPAGGTVRIPVMVDMSASWPGAGTVAGAKLLVGITTVQCAATLSNVWLVISLEPGF
jgi:hypothetical protein